MKRFSDVIVFIFQSALIYFVLHFSKNQNRLLNDIGLLLFVLIAIFIGLKAMYDMGEKSFAIAPKPPKESELITNGIYSKIRNPMYLSVLIFCGAFTTLRFSQLSLGFLVLLIFFLLIKIYFEEKYLNQKFNDYQGYKSRTKRLIPYVF